MTLIDHQTPAPTTKAAPPATAGKDAHTPLALSPTQDTSDTAAPPALAQAKSSPAVKRMATSHASASRSGHLDEADTPTRAANAIASPPTSARSNPRSAHAEHVREKRSAAAKPSSSQPAPADVTPTDAAPVQPATPGPRPPRKRTPRVAEDQHVRVQASPSPFEPPKFQAPGPLARAPAGQILETPLRARPRQAPVVQPKKQQQEKAPQPTKNSSDSPSLEPVEWELVPIEHALQILATQTPDAQNPTTVDASPRRRAGPDHVHEAPTETVADIALEFSAASQAEVGTQANSKAPPNRVHFTAKIVKDAPCPDGQPAQLYWDLAMPGFGLRVYANGLRSYIVAGRVRDTNFQRQVTIGRPSAALSLREAHDLAAAVLRDLRQGIDPKVKLADAEHKKEALHVTLAEVMTMYLGRNRPDGKGLRRPRTIANYHDSILNHLKAFANKPVSMITKAMCEKAFLRITETAPVTANETMKNLRALLNFARKHYRDGKTGNYPILVINPVDDMRESTPRNPIKAHNTRVKAHKVRPFYQNLRERSHTHRSEISRTAADWLSFRLLTGTRQTESCQLRFSDVDFDNNIITLNDHITKTVNVHPFPMSEPVRNLMLHRWELHLLAYADPAQATRDAWVFPSKRSASGHIVAAQTTFAHAIEETNAGVGDHLTPRDLRRTFEDVGSACHVDPDVRRRLLNHKLDVHLEHYANNPEALIEPVFAIGEWIANTEEIKTWAEQRGMPVPSGGDAAMAPATPLSEADERRAAWIALRAAELSALAQTLSTHKMAVYFHVSDRTVAKRCNTLGIPRAKPMGGRKPKACAGAKAASHEPTADSARPAAPELEIKPAATRTRSSSS